MQNFSPLFIGSGNVTKMVEKYYDIVTIFQSPVHRVWQCNEEAEQDVDALRDSFSPLFIGSGNATDRNGHVKTQQRHGFRRLLDTTSFDIFSRIAFLLKNPLDPRNLLHDTISVSIQVYLIPYLERIASFSLSPPNALFSSKKLSASQGKHESFFRTRALCRR